MMDENQARGWKFCVIDDIDEYFWPSEHQTGYFPVKSHRLACGDTQWRLRVTATDVWDDSLEQKYWNKKSKGSLIFTWVRTIPNRKVPIVRKNPAKSRRALDLREPREGSLVRVVCQRQTPGNMKMKTAARQPRRSITTPMSGISMANIKEATNLKIKN